jgi:hypothetical protein
MMRKIHRVALAALLKPLLGTLQPAFTLVKADVAKSLDTERRFAFGATFTAGSGFLLFHPAATATDDYFTLEVAWLRAPHGPAELDGDPTQAALIAPWKDCTREAMAGRTGFRLRVDDLWEDAPAQYRGSFRFSTAASRYCEAMFNPPPGISQKEREDQAFALLVQCTDEERQLTAEQATLEVQPAAALALEAVRSAALPFLQLADRLARQPAGDAGGSR